MMKKFVKPQMRIMSIVISENIASSAGNTGVCSLGRSYSAGKQECQNCKLYYNKYGTLPTGIDFSGAILTFSDDQGLGYQDKTSAIAAANAMSCPEGLV